MKFTMDKNLSLENTKEFQKDNAKVIMNISSTDERKVRGIFICHKTSCVPACSKKKEYIPFTLVLFIHKTAVAPLHWHLENTRRLTCHSYSACLPNSTHCLKYAHMYTKTDAETFKIKCSAVTTTG